MRSLFQLIPLVLAFAIAGQPVGEIVCGLSCQAGFTGPAQNVPAHACHDAAGATVGTHMEGPVPGVESSPNPGDEYAGAACRQSTIAVVGEDTCVWARQECPTLVAQKTVVAAPALSAILIRLNPWSESAPALPPSNSSHVSPVRLPVALRI
jgi:hypothetical protein